MGPPGGGRRLPGLSPGRHHRQQGGGRTRQGPRVTSTIAVIPGLLEGAAIGLNPLDRYREVLGLLGPRSPLRPRRTLPYSGGLGGRRSRHGGVVGQSGGVRAAGEWTGSILRIDESSRAPADPAPPGRGEDRTRSRSEEQTSELQSRQY